MGIDTVKKFQIIIFTFLLKASTIYAFNPHASLDCITDSSSYKNLSSFTLGKPNEDGVRKLKIVDTIFPYACVQEDRIITCSWEGSIKSYSLEIDLNEVSEVTNEEFGDLDYLLEGIIKKSYSRATNVTCTQTEHRQISMPM